MKMNKKIVIGLAIIAAFMMLAIPFAATQEGADADYQYSVIEDSGLYIAPAILSDNSSVEPITITDYGTVALADGTITLTMSEAYFHENANHTGGFWMGVAFASVDKTKTLYYAWDTTGATKPSSAITEANEGNVLVYDQTQYNGVAFYVAPGNGDSLNANSEYYVALKIGEDGNLINYTVKVVVTKYIATTEDGLKAAVAAGGNIALGADITLTETLNVNKVVTIDGEKNEGKYKITGLIRYGLEPKTGGDGSKIFKGTVELKNLQLAVTNSLVTDDDNSQAKGGDDVTLKFTSCDFTISAATDVVLRFAGVWAHIIIDECTFVNTPATNNTYAIWANSNADESATLEIKNSEFSGFSRQINSNNIAQITVTNNTVNSWATTHKFFLQICATEVDELAGMQVNVTGNNILGCADNDCFIKIHGDHFLPGQGNVGGAEYYQFTAFNVTGNEFNDGYVPKVLIEGGSGNNTDAGAKVTIVGSSQSPVSTIEANVVIAVHEKAKTGAASVTIGQNAQVVIPNGFKWTVESANGNVASVICNGIIALNVIDDDGLNASAILVSEMTGAGIANIVIAEDHVWTVERAPDTNQGLYKLTNDTLSKVTVNGNNNTITAGTASANSGTSVLLINVVGDNVKTVYEIKDLTIDAAQKLYSPFVADGTGVNVSFKNVTANNGLMAGINVLEGATATIEDVTADGNGAVQVRVGVHNDECPPSTLIMKGNNQLAESTTIQSPNKILKLWKENVTDVVKDGDSENNWEDNVIVMDVNETNQVYTIYLPSSSIPEGSITLNYPSLTAKVTLGDTDWTVSYDLTICSDVELIVPKSVTLTINATGTITDNGKLTNNGTIYVLGTLKDSYSEAQTAQMIVNTNGTINVAATGILMTGLKEGQVNIDGKINFATGGVFLNKVGDTAVNTLIAGTDDALIMMTAGTVTIGAKAVGGAVTYTLEKDAKATFAQSNVAGFAFKAGDVIDINGELTIATTITIPEGAKLNVNGKVVGDENSVIALDKTATLDIGSSATVSVGKIDMTGSNSGVKAVMIKTGGVITALIDGSTTEAESKANLENIVAGNGGITIIKGSVYINGTIATPDATGKITVPAGAVKISGNVEEGVTLEVPAGSSIVIPKDSTLTFEEGSKFNYDNAATITFEEKSSSIIYEKGSEVNDVVIEVETKEDSEGTTVAVRIYLVSENEKKLIISVDYVEVLPGKTYGDALNGVIVMPTKKTVTFDGWYNLAFNEKIRSTDIVGNYDVVLTACYSEEGRVIPIPDDDDGGSSDVPASSSNINEFALPIAFILLVCAIFALGFVIIRKK